MTREFVTLCFDSHGATNTDSIVRAAIDRAKDLGIEYLVVASTTGKTALRATDLVREAGYSGYVVVVGQHYGFKAPGTHAMPEETRVELERRGVRLVIATHALSSVARSFRQKWGGIDMAETIAETLRCFSQGVKVGVECAIMAADAGAIPVDRDVVVVGGSGGGADSAIIVRPANMNHFFDLKVRGIIGMPW